MKKINPKKRYSKSPSININNLKYKTRKQFDEADIKNEVNAFVQFIQQHGWTWVENGLPPQGNSLCVVALNDNTASYGLHGEVMNSTWFCLHYKEKGWTHWMLLPPRPSEVNNIMSHLFKGTKIHRD